MLDIIRTGEKKSILHYQHIRELIGTSGGSPGTGRCCKGNKSSKPPKPDGTDSQQDTGDQCLD